jgi:hypothetical protein
MKVFAFEDHLQAGCAIAVSVNPLIPARTLYSHANGRLCGTGCADFKGGACVAYRKLDAGTPTATTAPETVKEMSVRLGIGLNAARRLRAAETVPAAVKAMDTIVELKAKRMAASDDLNAMLERRMFASNFDRALAEVKARPMQHFAQPKTSPTTQWAGPMLLQVRDGLGKVHEFQILPRAQLLLNVQVIFAYAMGQNGKKVMVCREFPKDDMDKVNATIARLRAAPVVNSDWIAERELGHLVCAPSVKSLKQTKGP